MQGPKNNGLRFDAKAVVDSIPPWSAIDCMNTTGQKRKHPSGAKAQTLCVFCGTAEAVPFQSLDYSHCEAVSFQSFDFAHS
jgi:hypothetical protein